jgi:hypothetical protein
MSTATLRETGTTLYTAIVIAINLQMAQMINYWTWRGCTSEVPNL